LLVVVVDCRYSQLLATMNESYVTANNRDQALDAVLTLVGKSENCDRNLVATVRYLLLLRRG
jgi:hypothetical protein